MKTLTTKRRAGSIQVDPRVDDATTLGQRTLLAIDDDHVFVSLVELQLGPVVDRIRVETSSEQGLARALEEQPQVILIDLEMPGIDACGLCRQLKSDPRTDHIPILFLSTDGGEERVSRALQWGAHDVIRKPFRVPELRARVRAAMRAAGAGNEDGERVGGEIETAVRC